MIYNLIRNSINAFMRSMLVVVLLYQLSLVKTSVSSIIVISIIGMLWIIDAMIQTIIVGIEEGSITGAVK